jgi:hypothetical protein
VVLLSEDLVELGEGARDDVGRGHGRDLKPGLFDRVGFEGREREVSASHPDVGLPS